MLRLIRSGQANSRGALARVTGLSRSTVAQRVDALITAGYVREGGQLQSSGGRPAVVLEFDGRNKMAATVSIERRRVIVGLVNFAGDVLQRREHAVNVEEGPTRVLRVVRRLVQSMLTNAKVSAGSVAGIGVAVPAPVEHPSGRPIEPTIMPGWHDCHIREELESHFTLPVYVDNDVHLMTIAEYAKHETATDSMLYLHVSDDIGAGLILAGEIWRGVAGAAGAIGHTAVDGATGRCTCGNVGCVATIAGGRAVAQRLREKGHQVETAHDVADLARAGNATAKAELRDAGRSLGRVIAGAVNLLDPGIVVLGGECAQIQGFITGLREEVYRRALPLAAGHLSITGASLPHDPALQGAAALVAAELLEPRPVLEHLLAR